MYLLFPMVNVALQGDRVQLAHRLPTVRFGDIDGALLLTENVVHGTAIVAHCRVVRLRQVGDTSDFHQVLGELNITLYFAVNLFIRLKPGCAHTQQSFQHKQ